jgi:hypothetical protein
MIRVIHATKQQKDTPMHPSTTEIAHAAAQTADDELLFLCPDRDDLGFVPSSR